MTEAPNVPIGFGYKSSWWVVRSNDTGAVCAATDAVEVESVPWHEGFTKSHDKGIFISPPIGEWTLMHGADSDLHFRTNKLKELSKKLTSLSRSLGEAQFFHSYRVSDYYIWARAIRGKLDRFFAFLGETGEILWNTGSPTAVELELFGDFVTHEFELPESKDENVERRFHYPDEESILKLAANWSFNPLTLEENPAASHEPGRYARWNLVSGVRRPRGAKRAAPPKTLVDLIIDRKFDAAETLLEAGADANERSGEVYVGLFDDNRKIQETPLLALCRTIPEESPLIAIAIDLMWKLLDAGADIEAAGPIDYRAIHWACVNKCPPLLKAVIEAGADLESRDFYGHTALYRCWSTRSKKSLGLVKLLVEAGADVNAASEGGFTSLWGVGTDSIRFLVAHGADINHVSDRGTTPLHNFAHTDRMDAVEIVLELGANPKLPEGGETPLQMKENKYAEALAKQKEGTALTKREVERFESMIRRLRQAEAEWDAGQTTAEDDVR